jgi:hypothetical protein
MLVLWRVQNAKNPYPNGGKLDLFFLATKQRFGVFYLPQKPQFPQPFANLYIANRTWVDAALIIIPSEIARGPKKNK